MEETFLLRTINTLMCISFDFIDIKKQKIKGHLLINELLESPESQMIIKYKNDQLEYPTIFGSSHEFIGMVNNESIEFEFTDNPLRVMFNYPKSPLVGQFWFGKFIREGIEFKGILDLDKLIFERSNEYIEYLHELGNQLEKLR